MALQEDGNYSVGSLVDEEIDVVEQSPDQVLNERGSKKKGPHFSKDEDVILVSAWLNTSIDVINATDQTFKRLWQRISALFSESIGPNYPMRTSVSLTNRWHTLQEKVNKFQGCLAQIETRNPSGTTEKDMIEEAKQMYHRIHKGAFEFDHIWDILRTKLKWMTRNNLSSKKRFYASCSHRVHDSIDLDDDSTHHKPNESIERPLGRKAEKEKLKNKREKNKEGDLLENWKEYKMEMYEKKLKMQEEKMKTFSMESEKEEKIAKEKIDIEKEKINLKNKRLDLEANKFYIESENKMKIEKERNDLENKRLDLEAKKIYIEADNNGKFEKEMIDIKNKEIELDAKKFRHQQIQQEMGIILMDASNLDSEQKVFIESRRAEIHARNFE